jgi:hypothetical protein
MKNTHVVLVAFTSIWLISSCKKKSDDTNAVPVNPNSVQITCESTHLKGYMSGNLCTGTTYYLDSNLYVKKGDTLNIQPGVTIVATKLTAGIFVSGTILSNGTKDQPVIFTVPTANQDPSWGANSGAWGGIQCDSSATLVKLVYTKVLWTGGPDETGSPQYSIAVHGKNTSNTNVIIEDCEFYGGGDDGMRLEGPITISIRRNLFQHMGSSDGETINIKRGVKGDVAFNYIWSAANNGVKLESNSGGDFAPYTNVNVYNNTIVSSGFRKVDEPTASILIDNYANGSAYNNIFVNNHQGLRVTILAKTVSYGNNLFYSSVDSLRNFYYPVGDAGTPQSTDLISKSVSGANNFNPMFVKLDTDVFASADGNDPHLQSTSPALGKGNTNAPFNTYGIDNTKPNTDLGAFPTDGTGNAHSAADIAANGK